MVAQKNKDWYNPSDPGKFTFVLWAYNGGNYTFVSDLGSIADTNSTQEFYEIAATIPGNLTQDHYTVQAMYYTNTKDENGTVVVFYQCADVLAL